MNARSLKNRSDEVKEIIGLVEGGQLRNHPGKNHHKDKILSGLDAIIFIHEMENDRLHPPITNGI